MKTEYKSREEAGLVRERKQTVVDRELDRIYAKNDTVTPTLVLEEARDPKSKLHKFFEWDDAVAAEKHRMTQALQLIMSSRMVAVLVQNGDSMNPELLHAAPTEVRRLVSSFRGEGFKMRNEALDEEQTRAAFITKRKESLRAWCRSVVDIREFDTLRQVIEQAI